MNTRRLPPAFSELTIPETFSVTSICAMESCRLRLVATSDPTVEKLIAGPKAAAGSFHHDVIQSWASSHLDDAEAFLEERLAAWDAASRANPRTAHLSPLRSTMSGFEWIGFRRRIIDAMMRARSGRFPPTAARSTRHADREKVRSSPSLRIRGKPDLVCYPQQSRIQIRDFKTGLIWEENGALKQSILRQMSLYGLLLADEDPGAVIELVVDDGESTIVPFTREDARRTRIWLAELLSGMEVGRKVRALELSSPGAECRTCPVRHLCAAYRQTAPEWWKAFLPVGINAPHDTWGVVTQVGRLGELVRMRILDDAGRAVQVDMLSPRHEFVAGDLGRAVSFFGLMTRGSGRSHNGRRYHPHNFYEMPRDGAERRAWTLEAFAGSPAEDCL